MGALVVHRRAEEGVGVRGGPLAVAQQVLEAVLGAGRLRVQEHGGGVRVLAHQLEHAVHGVVHQVRARAVELVRGPAVLVGALGGEDVGAEVVQELLAVPGVAVLEQGGEGLVAVDRFGLAAEVAGVDVLDAGFLEALAEVLVELAVRVPGGAGDGVGEIGLEFAVLALELAAAVVEPDLQLVGEQQGALGAERVEQCLAVDGAAGVGLHQVVEFGELLRAEGLAVLEPGREFGGAPAVGLVAAADRLAVELVQRVADLGGAAQLEGGPLVGGGRLLQEDRDLP